MKTHMQLRLPGVGEQIQMRQALNSVRVRHDQSYLLLCGGRALR